MARRSWERSVSKLEDIHSRGMPVTISFAKRARTSERIQLAAQQLQAPVARVREAKKNIAWAKLTAVRDELNIFQPRAPGPYAMPAHRPKQA